MKKLLLTLVSFALTLSAWAGDGDCYVTTGGGFLLPSTLNASVGYEKELSYGNAVEVFGEIGDRWQRDPVCGKVCSDSFWKNYYWDGGILYKKNLNRYKNSLLRARIGPACGAVTGDYFFGVEAGFEYNIMLRSGIQFSIVQKNNVNFIHGDTFRNGLLLQVKIPIN